jgi:hypothetical protein
MVAHICNPRQKDSEFKASLGYLVGPGFKQTNKKDKNFAFLAHAYNSSYLGDRGWEGHSLKPAQEHSL